MKWRGVSGLSLSWSRLLVRQPSATVARLGQSALFRLLILLSSHRIDASHQSHLGLALLHSMKLGNIPSPREDVQTRGVGSARQSRHIANLQKLVGLHRLMAGVMMQVRNALQVLANHDLLSVMTTM